MERDEISIARGEISIARGEISMGRDDKTYQTGGKLLQGIVSIYCEREEKRG
jgi:hypothetical protein